MRDHGGDLDRAMARFGAGRWLDLSTGINPRPYPLPRLPRRAWTALPTSSEIAALEATAREAYGAGVAPVALAGAQAAIQLVPRLRPPGRACVLGPTYNEHAGALAAQGWQVRETGDLDGLHGADLAIVVNPNNPDGRRRTMASLLELSRRVGLLVVDESFVDAEPELSLAAALDARTDNLVLLRSFGKFYGLAGLRLGFALTGDRLAADLRRLAGPWAVSGPAIAAGRTALADPAWRAATIRRLEAEAARLDGLAERAGWTLVGGTPLFRTYATPDARAAQRHLAQAHVWSRIFPYSPAWIRLGLPGSDADWARLEGALGQAAPSA